jgi:hypothetical protein
MTKEEIEHMWKVASNDPHHDFNWFDPVVVKFAKLIAEKEREECAKACEEVIFKVKPIYCVVAENCVKVIRARGQE